MRNTVVAIIIAAALLGSVWLYNDSQERMQRETQKQEQLKRNAEYRERMMNGWKP